MTDLSSAPQGGSPEEQQPGLRVVAQFIRDLSFENPNAPDSLRNAAAQPQMDVGVEMNARGRPDGLFEVDLKVSATAQRDQAAVFHCELLYGGLFQVTGFPEDQVEPILMIECPRLLFPFVRQIIGELSVQGGFPPFLLDPLDFAGIYFAQKGAQQAQALQQAEPAGQA
jgi:preprotein translocase subunit SecB